MCVLTGGSRYSDNRYSDISKWVMQWVRVRDRVRVGVSCAFSEAFVGIAAVGIAACTLDSEQQIRHSNSSREEARFPVKHPSN